jgi:thiol-disulfide isomerase/thioredoxin
VGTLLGLALVASVAAQTVVVVGDEPSAVPVFEALRLDGTRFDSEELRGKTVLLDFWGTWCPPCIAAFPKLSSMHDQLGDADFQVLGLTYDSGTPEEVTDFLGDHRVTYPVVVIDEAVLDTFAVDYFPTYVLLGPDGRILETWKGQQTDLRRRVERLLDTLSTAG